MKQVHYLFYWEWDTLHSFQATPAGWNLLAILMHQLEHSWMDWN